MLTLVTPPTPFISLQEAKRHLRVDHSDDDLVINSLIKVAIDDLDGPDGRLARALGLQTWDWRLDTLCSILRVPLPPLVSVTNIKDGDAVVVDPSAYTVVGINTTRGGTIELAAGSAWPAVAVVRFQAGYVAIPEPVRQATILKLESLYDGRDNEAAIDRLLARFWVPRV